MSLSPIQHLLNAEGLFGGLLAFHADAHQMLGRQDDSVSPLDMVAVSSAADQADIASHDFGSDVGDEVFFQPKRIWRDWRLFLHSHGIGLLPHDARQDKTISVVFPTSQFYNYSKIRFRTASCAISRQHPKVESPFVAETPGDECTPIAEAPAPSHAVGEAIPEAGPCGFDFDSWSQS
jgi:hypothetical protein